VTSRVTAPYKLSFDYYYYYYYRSNVFQQLTLYLRVTDEIGNGLRS